MRIEIRDSEIPPTTGERKRNELVITTYVSDDGKTRHSQVIGLSDDNLNALALAVIERLRFLRDQDGLMRTALRELRA